MITNRPFHLRRRTPLLLLLAMTATGCGTWFNDQIDVPGTNQRIVVGSDNWPSKKAWVLVDGKLHPLVVQELQEKKQ